VLSGGFRKKFSHTKPQSHNATVGVQNFEPLHFCLLLETVTKNKPLLTAISSFPASPYPNFVIPDRSFSGSGIQGNDLKNPGHDFISQK
jgi:hypothetical protein